MVTINLIREAFAAIVEAHVSDVTFYHVLTPPKDEGDITFPACLWGRWSVNETPDGAGESRGSFTISCAFVDCHATDRTRAEASYAAERMEIIARQCWAKFYDTYVKQPGTYQSVDVDLEVDGTATFTLLVDDGPDNLAGVLLDVTLTDNTALACVDSYFD